MSIISFNTVSKAYGGRTVLDSLSFSVDRAQVYGLLGPNGCGKSTAINILCNLLDPDEGSVRIGDTVEESAVSQRAARLGWEIRRYAGKLACLIPQEISLKSVVDAFAGIDLSGVSLQKVSLEHAFLEVLQHGVQEQ